MKITSKGYLSLYGVTSTAVLKETIEMIGGEVNYYIPNRFTDGYGPNTAAFERLIEQGTQLIVTCDNGVAGHAAIERAKVLGIDVIVTDHHELPTVLPAAYAVVHPRHPKGSYPFGELAGVGVAFKLATALLGEMPVELLDLVAIGTVADLVSLTDENRALVMQGLVVLKNTQRIGLSALFKLAKIKREDIDEESIGFIIGPRLNAVGRLGDAAPAVELLTTFDDDEALSLAQLVQEKNTERQAYVSAITNEAFQMIEELDSDSAVYVLAKENWHEGVLGIVASKVVGKTGKPTLIMTIDKAKGLAKGSGRSIPTFHLYHALDSARQLTTTFGGHHMAAGLTIPLENIENLQHELNHYATETGLSEELGEETPLDGQLKLAEATVEVVEELSRLAPFGTDNRKPTFLFKNVASQDVRRIGGDQSHLKMKLVEENVSLDVIGFQFGSVTDEIGLHSDVSVIGKLAINEWNGARKTQLMLEDIAIEGVQVFDSRSTHIPATLWNTDHADFIFFDQLNFEKYGHLLPDTSYGHHLRDQEALTQFKMTTNQLIFVDCPSDSEWVKNLLSASNPEKIIACFYSREELYLNGMPTRAQFGQVFKYTAAHVDIDVRNKLNLLATHLKIKEANMIFIISVFLEIGFVTIADGVMNANTSVEKRALDQAKTYQKRLKQIQSENFFVYSHFSELEDWLKQQVKEMP
ncbi:single-stranded-DNA-specific exonuclease RecJ [Carnobacterium pleistocenium]|uniref:single-stranded-DNA-specific exonuclease RecJ n=1 Tax=Carnobacterium pleistocenium TaxID=181073 RepID=UPI000B0BB4BD|nr:single-stranded-DNA-specific exonuclease RecJ [Carnobacterium pleistocenium]